MQDIRKIIRATPLPLSVREVRRAYVFGSSLDRDNPNDIDVALIVDELNPIFVSKLQIYSVQVGVVEYHIIPTGKWFWRRLTESADLLALLPKRYLRSK